MLILVGNMFALLASLTMVLSSYVKDKKRSLYLGSLQLALSTAANAVLGAWSGAISNGLGVPRNVLAANGRLTLPWKWSMTVLPVALVLVFNDMGLVGLLPAVATAVYTLTVERLRPVGYKILTVACLAMWLAYDLSARNFVSAAFDIGSIAAACAAISRLKKGDSDDDGRTPRGTARD